jgi:hypothetical protein
MSHFIFAIFFVLVLSSCASSPGTSRLDAEADARLGADQDEQIYEAQETIQAIQQRNQQEQKSALQRQITETNF